MPKLSVIIPFTCAESYLAECLASVRRQTMSDLEILLVPVESPSEVAPDEAVPSEVAPGEAVPGEADEAVPGEADTADDAAGEGTPEMADAMSSIDTLVAEDARVRVLDLPGEPAGGAVGPGRARDLGARAASGEYLAFVDPADGLPAYAYTCLIRTLDRTGSDFASGNVVRFNELGTRRSAWYGGIFDKNADAVHVSEVPALLKDRLSGNKVWRRSFWHATRLEFGGDDLPETLTVLRAHFAASSVDMLAAPVYQWRDTAVPESLPTVGDIDVVFAAVDALTEFIGAHRPPADLRLWQDTALRTDLWRLLTYLDEADSNTRQKFLDRAAAYLAAVPPEVLNGLPALRRVDWYLVARRDLTRLLEMLTFQKSVELKRARAVRRGLRYYAQYPFLDDEAAGVPRRLYRLEDELSVRRKTESIVWSGDGKLVIGGRAGIRFLRSGRRLLQQLVAFLVDPVSGRRTPVPTRVRRAAEYRLRDSPDAARHDWGGFEIVIDPERLRIDGTWQDAQWRLELMVVNRGLVRRRLLGGPVGGAPRRPEPREVAPDVWVRPSWEDGALQLTVEPRPPQFTAHRMDGDDLVLSGHGAAGPRGVDRLRVSWRSGAVQRDYPVVPDGDAFTVRVDVRDLLDGAELAGTLFLNGAKVLNWDVEALLADGSTRPIALSAGTGEGRYTIEGKRIAVQRLSTGYLRLQTGRPAPVLQGADWSGPSLTIRMGYETAVTGHPELVLKARGRNEEHAFAVDRDGDRLTATFEPLAVHSPAGVLPLPSGSYEMLIRTHEDGQWQEARGELDHEFIRALPLTLESGHRTVTLTNSGFDVPVLSVTGDQRPEERGTYAQQQLREVTYPALCAQSVLSQIYFDSYTGRQFSDSPRAILEELRRRDVAYPTGWLVRDGQVALPDGITPVRHTGRPYYEWLARSAYLVSNSRQPAWFQRREGQVVLQTWHGSMLKRIGFDIEKLRGKSRDYHEKLAHEVAQWDYLVSPSPWATPILRQAFRFDGEVLETGYPRNDIFFSPQREQIAERTRRLLGLPADKKIVMYAPTWRDDKFYSRGKYKLDLRLDLDRAYERLGADHVLLVRRHPWVVDRVPTAGRDFVYDVSTYPEIMDLFLITDVLITDYSSLMFDFANTGRPMLFFTYDIAAYRDNLRGFYFDFESTAPGPLLSTSDEVIEAVADADAVRAAHEDRYRAFVERFCPLDDGKAAARIVDRVFPNLH